MVGMALHRKRRCGICRHWFRPDPRVGKRQRVCSAQECQRARHARDDARWRARNPDYFTGLRLARQLAARRDAERRPPRGVEAPAPRAPPARIPRMLRSVPWDLAEGVLGVCGCYVLALALSRAVRFAQDEIAAERLCSSVFSPHLPESPAQAESAAESVCPSVVSSPLPESPAQDEIGAGAHWSRSASGARVPVGAPEPTPEEAGDGAGAEPIGSSLRAPAAAPAGAGGAAAFVAVAAGPAGADRGGGAGGFVALVGDRRLQAAAGTGAAGGGDGGGDGVGAFGGGGVGARSHAAHGAARDGAGAGLAAAGAEGELRVEPAGAGAALRPQPELGLAPAGAGERAARGDPGAGAPGAAPGAGGDEVAGAAGAR